MNGRCEIEGLSSPIHSPLILTNGSTLRLMLEPLLVKVIRDRLTSISSSWHQAFLHLTWYELDQSNERYQYYVHGFEQSKRFRSLKVWMSFKRYGARQIGEWVDNNVRQAKHLYALAERHPEFEPASIPPMSAICIRFRMAPG